MDAALSVCCIVSHKCAETKERRCLQSQSVTFGAFSLQSAVCFCSFSLSRIIQRRRAFSPAFPTERRHLLPGAPGNLLITSELTGRKPGRADLTRRNLPIPRFSFPSLPPVSFFSPSNPSLSIIHVQVQWRLYLAPNVKGGGGDRCSIFASIVRPSARSDASSLSRRTARHVKRRKPKTSGSFWRKSLGSTHLESDEMMTLLTRNPSEKCVLL